MKPRHPFRPNLESLEVRAVPTSGIGIEHKNGILTLIGSDRADRHDVATVKVERNKVVAVIVEKGLDNKVKAAKVKKVDLARVRRVDFRGYAGNDSFRNDTGITSIAEGGAGDDSLTGGWGRDYLYGGAGKDYLDGRGGNDFLLGQDGDDGLSGGAGNDRLYGQAGSDNLGGGAGDDSLYGGDGNDLLYGEAGNDYLFGAAGDDSLYGGTGLDRLYGQAGADFLDGGWDYAKDELWGGTERDVFFRYYKAGFLGIRTYGEEIVRDYEGILGSWDTTREYRIG